MRKLVLILIVAFFSSALARAQKGFTGMKRYKASNGVTYKVGDTISMRDASGINGKYTSFSYIGTGNIVVGMFDLSGVELPIINIVKHKDDDVIYLLPDTDYGFRIDIETAIKTCEISPCVADNSNKKYNITPIK